MVIKKYYLIKNKIIFLYQKQDNNVTKQQRKKSICVNLLHNIIKCEWDLFFSNNI